MSKLNILLGTQIKRYRKRKNLTQEQLGERAGITRPRISEIERGVANLTISTLENILNALEIDLHELFNFGDVAKSPDIETKETLIYYQQELLKGLSTKEIQYIYNTTKEFIATLNEKK
ncbi:helix-turn-helix transcriptional regulator [Metasolibacillus sp. FSL H7-0170]|uniref:helix-turn-helix domain-containing protein n=1 Tax=Metasolibacillus TaxID=2703677 RepID=UPI0007952B0D|nr:helix-turn-helix transcriptional regulator [Metasolibacillus fluoroglycofenilyticus]KYG90594.1 hypothetical protein A0U40_06370 [[Bacillus] sp. KCTC 13219]